MATPVNSATIAGPVRNAYDAAVMTTKSASPSSSAGPDTAGPSTTMMTGTTPEQSAIAFAACPQPCSAAMPSTMSAPLDAMCATRGRRWSLAVRAASASVPDAVDDSAPRRSEASMRTTTTERSSRTSTKAWTAPGVRARSATSTIAAGYCGRPAVPGAIRWAARRRRRPRDGLLARDRAGSCDGPAPEPGGSDLRRRARAPARPGRALARDRAGSCDGSAPDPRCAAREAVGADVTGGPQLRPARPSGAGPCRR